MRTHLPTTLERARKLRREMSLPEILLWQQMKTRPGGYKFRKQHPFGRIVPDFYCHAGKLVIEVDGEAHNRGDQPEYDIERDRWLRSQGLEILRITAREILSDLDAVVQHIVVTLDKAN